MKRSAIVVLAVLLTAASASGAQTIKPVMVTQPNWITKPSVDAFSAAYPPMAMQLDLDGHATLTCVIDQAGRLQDCTVTEETPKGLGFGRAALSLTGGFLLHPATLDGRVVDRQQINIPIRFHMPSSAPVSFQAKPPTSPQAMTLARELVIAVKAVDSPGASFDYAARQLETEERLDLSPEARLAIAKALRAAYPPRVEAAVEQQAAVYAAAFDTSQLTTLLKFFRSPTGVTLNTQTPAKRAIQARIGADYPNRVRKIARATFCATRTCLPENGEPMRLPAPAAPAAVDIPQPEWLHMPSLPQVWLVQPGWAKTLNISGEAQLTCVVRAEGAIGQCRVARETPGGLGFGDAARSLAPFYRIGETPPNGGPPGKTVAVLVELPAGVQEGSIYVAKPPRSAEAQALARTLLNAIAASQTGIMDLQKQRATSQVPPAGATRADIDAVYDALGAAAETARLQIVDLQAADFSRLYTDRDLKAGLAFWRSPVGRAWAAKTPELTDSARRIGAETAMRVWSDVSQAFCAGRDCLPPPAPQPSSSVSSAPSTLKP
jgi:TonB family protein